MSACVRTMVQAGMWDGDPSGKLTGREMHGDPLGDYLRLPGVSNPGSSE